MNVFDLAAKLSLDTSEYDSKLSAISSGVTNVAKVGIAALTATSAAVVGFGKESVEVGLTFDKSISQVAATMGMTVKDMEDQVGEVDTAFGHFSGNLREYAKFMGSNTAFSASQAADALNYMALAGYDVQTSMGMLPNVLNLAAAGGMDLAKASDMITDSATAMGMILEDGSVDIERVTLMTNEMAKAASTGNTNVEQLGEAFLVVGGLAKELNGGIVTLEDGTQATADGVQELEIALTGMANAGIKGSEAGTHMRNMLLKLSSPSKDGAAALETLGVAVFDAEGNMRSLKDIFSDMNNAMKGDLRPAFESFYGYYAQLTDEARIKEFQKNPEEFERLGVSIADAEGNLRSFEDVMADVDEIASQGGISQEYKLGLISDMFNTRDVAAAEALLGAIEQDWDSIGESVLSAGEDGGAAAKMAETQLNNLSGDIVKFKSALEGAQIAVSDSLSPELREFVQMGTEGISRLTKAFSEGGLEGAVDEMGNFVNDSMGKIVEKLPSILDTGSKVFGTLVQGFSDNAPKISEAAISLVQNLANIITQNAPVLVSAVVPLIVTVATTILENLPFILEAAIQIIVTLAEGLTEALPELVPAVVEAILTMVQILAENEPLIIDAAVNLIIALVDGIMQSFPIINEAIPKLIATITVAMAENAPQLAIAGAKLLGVLISGFVNAIPSMIYSVVMIIPEMIDALKKYYTDLVAMGKDFVYGLQEGFTSAWTSFTQNVSQTASKLIGDVKKIFGIASPSKVFAGIGENMALGMEKGWEDEFGDVKNDIESDLNFETTSTNERKGGTGSRIVIPIYLGGQLIDEYIVEATQRIAYRSGGALC